MYMYIIHACNVMLNQRRFFHVLCCLSTKKDVSEFAYYLPDQFWLHVRSAGNWTNKLYKYFSEYQTLAVNDDAYVVDMANGTNGDPRDVRFQGKGIKFVISSMVTATMYLLKTAVYVHTLCLPLPHSVNTIRHSLQVLALSWIFRLMVISYLAYTNLRRQSNLSKLGQCIGLHVCHGWELQ